ncbi:MAG: carbohydrate kinase family protein [Lachnospiraceae bacterium]|nr:carbohydrate kinase family protein [Lachnospiraceae bacterium]
MKVLCVGLAVMDISARPISQKSVWEEKQSIDEISIQLGGDAVNQCIYLNKLDMEPGLNICIGPDSTGQMLVGALKQQGIDTSQVCVRKDSRTGTSLVIIDDAGERRIFSATGAERLLHMEDLPNPLPEGLKAISLASLFGLDHLERDGLDEYLKNARQQGVLVFADTIYDKFGIGLKGVAHLFPQIDYFLPSSYEAATLTGTSTPEESAAVLRDLGVGTAIIKCGGDGVYVDGPDFRGQIPAMKVDPLDTTGAGDCFVACFIALLLKGYSVEEACRLSCRASSWSTLSLGASTAKLSWDVIDTLKKQ